MAIVPEIVEKFLAAYGKFVEQWFSAQLYQRLVQHNRQHILVQLSTWLDFGPLEAGCQGYAHSSGPGAKPTHRIDQLVRALLVKYLYNWSLRETEAHLNSNLLLRWFVGYGVLEAVLDHSTLERFEQWVRGHQPRLYFDTVLRQIDEADPQLRQGCQIGDTYACQANAEQESIINLLRHTSRLLLEALQQAAPQLHTRLLLALDLQQLFGTADEGNYHYLKEAERQQRKERTVCGAWQLRQLLLPELARLPEPLKAVTQARLDTLHKIIGDDFQVTSRADGQLTGVVERDAKHKGEYRLHSASDPEATLRNHGRDCTLGYNVSLAVTPSGFIREIQAATGAEPDQAGVARLIRAQIEQHGLCPEKLIYDQAAGAGRTRAEVERVSAGRTQLVARIPPPSVSGRYTPADFHFEQEGLLLCPAQRSTRARFRASDRDGWIYEFSGTTCKGCPLRQHCREPQARPMGARRVFISDYQEYIRQAQAYNQTEDFKREMRLRPLVERVILMLTHYDGARRARCRGLQGADFQAKMCATVRNIRTWLKLSERQVLAPCPNVAAGL